MLKQIFIPLLMLSWLTSAAATEITRMQLDNGLEIRVKVDQRSPVVVSQLWYRVGSSDEHNGITGVSHVLEHMMFKRTKRLAAGEFSETVALHGGRDNAFTSRYYTAYVQSIAVEHLELCFELEAERMQNLQLSQADFATELEVVKEERRTRTDDNPRGALFELFNAASFVASPIRNPIIGWPSDLATLKLADVQAWYDRWYAPNNAILVVVGDVDPEQVLALATKHFGPIPAKTLPHRKPRAEPPQHGTRSVKLQRHAQLPYLLMGYKVPVMTTAINDWEPFALDVAAGVLAGGASSRLLQSLVREQELAAGASAGYDPYAPGGGQFIVSGTPASGRTIDELRAGLTAELERLKHTDVSLEELARIKAQVVAAQVYERDSLSAQAMDIGVAEVLDIGLSAAVDYPRRIQAVTQAQIRQVAAKYFVPDQLTVAELVPLAAE